MYADPDFGPLDFGRLDDSMSLYMIVYREDWARARNFFRSNLWNYDLRRAVLFRNEEGRTILTMILLPKSSVRRRISIQYIPDDIAVRIIEFGGRDLAMTRHGPHNQSPLHYACTNDDPSRRVVQALITAGGMDVVFATDINGMTALHYVCNGFQHASDEVVLTLLRAGGKELVMAQDVNERTALHYACLHISSSTVLVKYLIYYGALDLVLMTDIAQMTALHLACSLKLPSIEVIRALIEKGGIYLFRMQDRMDRTVLDFVDMNSTFRVVTLLLRLERHVHNQHLLEELRLESEE